MSVEITVPEVGESITEGVLVQWHVADGEAVESDAPLFELETDKITMTVNAEASGVVKHKVGEEETVQVGQVVGTIDTEAEPAEDGGGQDAGDDEEADQDGGGEDESSDHESDTAGESGDAEGETREESAASDQQLAELAPSVRRLVKEHNLDPSAIEGSGKGGRLTKGDVQAHLEQREKGGKSEQKPEQKSSKEKTAEKGGKKAEKPSGNRPPTPSQENKRARAQQARPEGERQTRKPMSQIRKRIAERLVAAQHNAAMLTTFNEVDMTRLMELRGQFKSEFEEAHGIKLGVMSFFVKAAVDALQRFPQVNSFIEGEEMVENHFYNIGIAVSTDRGLMVPVIKDAAEKSFAEIEHEIMDFATRAREGKIQLDELQGGTFTITNGGVFGSMMSTPILNTPQSAILGMHGIKKRPMVIEEGGEERIEVRKMMYLAMSYDHRVIDGRESVTFLRRIMEVIEHPERLLFDV